MKNTKGAVAMAIAAILMVVALILPAYNVSFAGESEVIKLTDCVKAFVPIIGIAAGLIGAVIAFLGKKTISLALGIIATLAMAISFFVTKGHEDVQLIRDMLGDDSVKTGIGFILTLIAAILMLVTTIFAFVTAPKE